MPPKEAAAAAPPARTVTPITCAYEELLRQEPHVLAAVEKVCCFKKKREERRDAKFGDGAHRVPPSNDDGGDFLPLPLFSCSHPASLPLNNQPTDQPGLRSRRPRRHRRLGSPRPPARPRQAPPARPEARDVPDGGPAPRARGPGVEVQLWLEPREGVSVRREGGRQKGVLLCESFAA